MNQTNPYKKGKTFNKQVNSTQFFGIPPDISINDAGAKGIPVVMLTSSKEDPDIKSVKTLV